MYHISAHMMGRVDGKQYPHMLAKHYAGLLGLGAATLVLVCQVGRGGGGSWMVCWGVWTTLYVWDHACSSGRVELSQSTGS